MSLIKLSDLLNLILITADTPTRYVIIRDEKQTIVENMFSSYDVTNLVENYGEMMVTRIEISETHKQLLIFCENTNNLN